jgi:hypothetical protein
MPTERRKNLRNPLGLPLRVRGFLADGSTWEELSTTVDVSSDGACFTLTHEAELGQVLLLSLPLPKRLRQFDLDDANYRVYSLVRGVRRKGDQVRVGVMFFGQHPPRGFKERPAARYLLPTDPLANAQVPQGLRDGDTPDEGSPAVGVASDAADAEPPSPDTLIGAPAGAGMPAAPVPGAPVRAFQSPIQAPSERRRAPRVELFVNFTVQLVDEWGAVLQEELTVADNISRGGARVMTSLGFQVGDVLLLQEAGGGFATRAEVRAITKVQPAVDRLHLRFLDRQAPDRLLKQ